MAAGGLGGGISSKLAGGTFEDGFRNGLISAGLNHGLHSVANGIEEANRSFPAPKKVGELKVVEFQVSANDVYYGGDIPKKIGFEVPVVGTMNDDGKLYWKPYNSPEQLLNMDANYSATLTSLANPFSNDINQSYSFSYKYNEVYNFLGINAAVFSINLSHTAYFGYSGKFIINNTSNQFQVQVNTPQSNIWFHKYDWNIHVGLK